ncbi:uncharacterized protein TNCV_2885071 [Trichonephila clavipes]|nr:uncharacterized protein TNCV_2885071 [Trichonephila clavipes]
MFLERHAAGCIPLNGRKEDCHMHIFWFWLINKITPDQIDQIISAEIPDKHIDTNLFDVVTKNMIHGPCGAFNNNSSCMSDGNARETIPQENWFLILSLAMTDIHCIVDDQLRMVANPSF